MEQIAEIATKTFKEVHQELEAESTFLTKNHPIAEFKQKSEFLHSAGFHASIATRLYGAISDSAEVVKEITRKYKGQHKFILEPQLERVCEKYNLYVRDVSLFIGDIPEKNIKDIMNFKVFISDLPEIFVNKVKQNEPDHLGRKIEGIEEFTEMFNTSYADNFQLTLKEIGEIENAIKKRVTYNWEYYPVLEIAAVKNLLSPIAFKDSNARILNNRPQAEARFQVNLDPIVLCNTKHEGRIIVTAWGDEANDELIANHNRN